MMRYILLYAILSLILTTQTYRFLHFKNIDYSTVSEREYTLSKFNNPKSDLKAGSVPDYDTLRPLQYWILKNAQKVISVEVTVLDPVLRFVLLFLLFVTFHQYLASVKSFPLIGNLLLFPMFTLLFSEGYTIFNTKDLMQGLFVTVGLLMLEKEFKAKYVSYCGLVFLAAFNKETSVFLVLLYFFKEKKFLKTALILLGWWIIVFVITRPVSAGQIPVGLFSLTGYGFRLVYIPIVLMFIIPFLINLKLKLNYLSVTIVSAVVYTILFPTPWETKNWVYIYILTLAFVLEHFSEQDNFIDGLSCKKLPAR